VDGAEVHFIGAGMNAVGKTDAQGKYELEQGAVVGENLVYITKFQPGSADNQQELDAAQMEAMAFSQGSGGSRGGPKQVIPAKYSDPANLNLQIVVPSEGTDAADFQLTSR
jgi:hypothetical protein